MKIDTGKCKASDKRFHKIAEFLVEKSSPSKIVNDEAPVEKEAEAIVKYRKAKALARGKSTYEDS